MFDFLEKAALNTIGPAVSLLLAAIIGQRISAKWAERQKKREHELALANAFYTSFGEFLVQSGRIGTTPCANAKRRPMN